MKNLSPMMRKDQNVKLDGLEKRAVMKREKNYVSLQY